MQPNPLVCLVTRYSFFTHRSSSIRQPYVEMVPSCLSHLLAQPPEEPPQERSSPPRSRQPTKEYIDTREEARVQRRRVSQLICGPVVAQLICGPGVELYRG